MKKTYLLYTLVFTILLAQLSAFGGVSLSLSPKDTAVKAGGEFVVDVNVGTDTSLISVMALLLWDSSKLEFVEYIVPEAFDDLDNISVGWNVEDKPGMTVVGVAKFFQNVLTADNQGTIAQLKFKVKDGVAIGTAMNFTLSLDRTKYRNAEIGVYTSGLDVVDATLTGATAKVAKLFNVSSWETTFDDGWMPGEFLQIPLGINVSYTDENGEAYPGGKVTAIDAANITVKVGGEEKDYTAGKYGVFTLSSNNSGTVNWDGEVTEFIGHNNLEFVIPFIATSNDGVYTDTNTMTMTVIPANNLPVLSDFAIVTEDEFGMQETLKVKFTFTISDVDGDATNPVAGSVKLNGEALAGTFSEDNGVWTFTGTEPLSQDLVQHTLDDNNKINDNYYLPWTITFNITDGIDIAECGGASYPDLLTTGIQDVDRVVTAPTFTKYVPAAPTTNDDITVVFGEATDEDAGDTITYYIDWSCGSKRQMGETLPAARTAKGETWKATIFARSKVGTTNRESESYVEGPEITIGNTAPTLAAATESILIRKGGAASGKVEFTITDADADDAFTVTANGVKGTAVASAVTDGKFTVTYTVNDPDSEFNDGKFTVKVSDGDAESNEVTVAVTYMENQPPTIQIVGDSDVTLDEVDADGEATTQTLKIKAFDATDVSPYGIKSIVWSITDGDGIEVASESNKSNTADANGNYPTTDDMEIAISTKGYGTLAGKDRSASETYIVTVEVTDGLNAVTSQNFTVTVKDADRAPSAPTNCDVVYVGGIQTGATVQVNGQGAADPDGDEVSYVYKLYVDDELVETSDATAPGTKITFATALKKGQDPEVVVVAVSKPAYAGGVQVQSDEYKSGKIAKIENSAPVITVPEGDGAVAIEEFVAGYNEADVTFTIGENADVKFAYIDIDEDAEADEVTVTVDGEGLAGFATAAIVDGKLLITREPNVNTVGLNELPYFKLVATDQDGAAAEAKFNLTINPINEKPVIQAPEEAISIVPGVEPEPIEFAVTFGTSADEAEQTIANVEAELADESGILASYEIATSENGKKVVLTYTPSENVADMVDNEATLTFKVQDNGGIPFEDTSDEVTVKFVVKQGAFSLTYNIKSYDGSSTENYKIYDNLEPGKGLLLFAPSIINNVWKFVKWDIEGMELEYDEFPIVPIIMPNRDVTVNALMERLDVVPKDWTIPKQIDEPMVLFGSVALPNGNLIDDDNTLVGLFDDDGNCYGVGEPISSMSAEFGYSVYYLFAYKNGTQEKGLTLKFWNRLTDEIIPINEKLDFVSLYDSFEEDIIDSDELFAKIGAYEPFRWTMAYKLNDASNPDSPYFNPYIYGNDVEGTVFSMVLGATWDNSLISYDFKLRLHNSATTKFDAQYDTMQPPLLPPFDFEEYAYLLSSNNVPLQLDSRPADVRSAQWTMKVVVPEGKPATISWNAKNIPEEWDATVKLLNEDGEVEDKFSLKANAWCAEGASDGNSIYIETPGEWYLVFDFFNYDGLETFEYTLKPGWNLITPTMNLLDESIDDLLALGVSILSNDNVTYLNATREDIVPGKALWIFCHDYDYLEVLGEPVGEWELSVDSDWSLVGAIEDIEVEDLPEDLFVWEWTAAGYRLVTGGLVAGKAYWMYMAN